jgi:ABC-type sugar transport system ATPase subunit
MSLLELEHVSKSYDRRAGRRVALRDVSLQIEAGERVAVWGQRHSGRSTLLRVAAGVEVPDEGVVRFDGHDLAARGARMGQGGIGYCQRSFHPSDGETVIDQVAVRLFARGPSRSSAEAQAHAALELAGAGRYAAREPEDLDGAESVRVSIARALAYKPRLLVIDEPTVGVDLLERDSILRLLRSLANQGIAVLTSTAEATGLTGVDRGLTIDDGVLRGRPSSDLAPVLPLRRAQGRLSA